MKKIVFAGHDFKFLWDVIDIFRGDDCFEVRVDRWVNHNRFNKYYSEECIKWADVIFCEWGLYNAVWYSQRKLSHQRMIVRLHRQEIELTYHKDFNYDNIDQFIVVSMHYYSIFKEALKIPDEKLVIIPNYVDFSRFECNNPFEERRFNIGMLGFCPMLKRPDLAFALHEKLSLYDVRYRLFFKGKHPLLLPWLWKKRKERIFFFKLFISWLFSPCRKNIVFEPYSKDVEKWFSNIGFILSMSDYESFHLAPLEGIASGAIPVIRSWQGSDQIYTDEFVFHDLDEMTDFIIQQEQSLNDLKNKFMKYDIMNVYNRIKDLLVLI